MHVVLPDGTRFAVDEFGVVLGRENDANSAALADRHFSRTQWRLTRMGQLLRLEVLGLNETLVLDASGARVGPPLAKGAVVGLRAGWAFALNGGCDDALDEQVLPGTVCRVAVGYGGGGGGAGGAEVQQGFGAAAAAGAAVQQQQHHHQPPPPPPPPPQQQQQQHNQHHQQQQQQQHNQHQQQQQQQQQQQHAHDPAATIDLTGGVSDGGGPAGKRRRVGGGSGSGASGSGASGSGSGSGAEPWLYEDTPMRLQAVRGLPARDNSGALGFCWRELAGKGPIEEVVVLNYMIDLPYLLAVCPALWRARRALIVHGEGKPWARRAAALAAAVRAVNAAGGGGGGGGGARLWTAHFPPITGWGTHHSKCFLLRYPTGLRVIVHSANLIMSDMENKTQSAYWQDFPRKDAASPPSSDFEDALRAYFARNELGGDDAALVERLLSDHDFSSARAALVASASGRFSGESLHQFGHMRVRALLAAEPMPAAWRALPLVAQFSSLGSLHEDWMHEQFVPSFTAGRYAAQAPAVGSGTAAAAAAGVQPAPGPPLDPSQVYLVWPTVAEVAGSNEGWDAGGSIPGPLSNVTKDFLQPLWARWGGAPAGRMEAMPHLKTFLRFDPATKQIAWLLQGSHNLSVAAWGRLEKEGTQLYVPSYELSALSLPSLELAYRRHRHYGSRATTTGPGAGGGSSAAAAPPGTQQQSVSFFAARQARADDIAAAAAAGAAPVLLPVPYKLPPERYGAAARDKPWCWKADRAYYEPHTDAAGKKYSPPRLH